MPSQSSPERAKIVVVGPGEAGKSTLIQAIAKRPMNLEVRGRTVAMDHGMLTRDGRSVALVGVPGQERFAGVREALARGAAGAIWVHPAGEIPDPETIRLLGAPELRGVPYLVCVNIRPGDVATGFPTPRGLPPPRVVLRGSLAAPGPELRQLEREIWALVGGL